MLVKSALRALFHFKLLVVWLPLMLKTLVYSNKRNRKVYCPIDVQVRVEKQWDLFLKEINGFMLNVTDQYCISPATSKGGFSCHPGDLSRKCHLCHGSCKSRKRGTRPPSSHYKTVRNIFPSLPSRWLYFTLGNGGCALTFAGIMFLCTWFFQLYML